MVEKEFIVMNKLTESVVFTGTLNECKQKVLNDATGYLELVEYEKRLIH